MECWPFSLISRAIRAAAARKEAALRVIKAERQAQIRAWNENWAENYCATAFMDRNFAAAGFMSAAAERRRAEGGAADALYRALASEALAAQAAMNAEMLLHYHIQETIWLLRGPVKIRGADAAEEAGHCLARAEAARTAYAACRARSGLRPDGGQAEAARRAEATRAEAARRAEAERPARLRDEAERPARLRDEAARLRAKAAESEHSCEFYRGQAAEIAPRVAGARADVERAETRWTALSADARVAKDQILAARTETASAWAIREARDRARRAADELDRLKLARRGLVFWQGHLVYWNTALADATASAESARADATRAEAEATRAEAEAARAEAARAEAARAEAEAARAEAARAEPGVAPSCGAGPRLETRTDTWASQAPPGALARFPDLPVGQDAPPAGNYLACVACDERAARVLFETDDPARPCGHICYCATCAMKMRASGGPLACPVCRAAAAGWHWVYNSGVAAEVHGGGRARCAASA